MRNRPALLEALADVKELRKRVLDRQLFHGYSGQARILGGFIALIGAVILSQSGVPTTRAVHVFGWGIICALAGAVNFVALGHWWKRREIKLEHLRPVLDLLAPFLVGGVLSFSLITQSAHDLLFPMWMWLFGLRNISSRHCLPKAMVFLGWYYIVAGAVFEMSLPYTSFLNPLPMGIVFFLGEVLGGLTFVKLRLENEI